MANSLQQIYAPANVCFGCGPANPDGLQIKSFPEGDDVVTRWQPETRYEAAPNILNGGIIGTLFDCHSNWTGLWHMMQQHDLDHPPATVTGKYEVKFRRPTPTEAPIELRGRAVEIQSDRVTVESELLAQGELCATFRGTFIVVPPGHPAYQRW